MQLYFYLIYFYFFYLFWKKLAAITASRAVQPAICSLERHFLSLQLSLTPLPHTLSLFPRAILLITAHNYSSHTHISFVRLCSACTPCTPCPLPTSNVLLRSVRCLNTHVTHLLNTLQSFQSTSTHLSMALLSKSIPSAQIKISQIIVRLTWLLFVAIFCRRALLLHTNKC